MWKESYKLGDALVDAQHKELFEKTAKLLGIIAGQDFFAKKQECIDAIFFLKEYAVNHFAAEEDFQASVNYIDAELHKLIHSDFVHSVLAAEQKLTHENFSLESIKEFAGFLTAWLIYHVAGADQKIVTNEELSYSEMAILMSPQECFLRGMEDVFETMLGEPSRAAETVQASGSGEVIRIKAVKRGSINRIIVFTFPKETALNLVKDFTNLELIEVDELAQAALSEVAALIVDKFDSMTAAAKAANEKNMAEVEKGIGDLEFNTKYGKILISDNVL